MKNLIQVLFIVMVITIANSASAQNITDGLKTKSGVYMSFADFKANKLNLEVDYTKEKHKIKINEFLNKSEIDVIHQDKKYSFKKKEVYGIRDGKGADYRFFNDLEYRILQTDTIYIYSKNETVKTGNSKNQRTSQVTKYFFSKSGDSELLALTYENLKQAFPENHKMHDALEMMFKSDSDLAEYDKFHKSFKVIRFIKGEMEH
ncbi:MAG: hypothetical protein U0W24_00755 [Bacteroidales bacterium]